MVIVMGSRTSQMVLDGLPKIPKSTFGVQNLKFRWEVFYPDLARSAEKVSRSVKEGHGKVSEHREYMPKHPDFVNFGFGNP